VDPVRHPHLARLTVRGSESRGRIARTPFLCHDARAVPTYDYQCRACGTVTEVIHSMLDDGPAVCELCGGGLRRVLYPTGIIFKGSGFYRNDSRASTSSSSVAAADKSGGQEPSTAGGGEAASGSTSPSDGATSTKKPSAEPSST
jgi:putative FmdB family regulatory protein